MQRFNDKYRRDGFYVARDLPVAEQNFLSEILPVAVNDKSRQAKLSRIREKMSQARVSARRRIRCANATACVTPGEKERVTEHQISNKRAFVLLRSLCEGRVSKSCLLQ